MDQQCNGCKTHAELVAKYGGSYTKIDTHCNRKCETGKKLQELGKQLSK
ncbi:zinc-finger domain-containing protein [Paenibacillus pabuli]